MINTSYWCSLSLLSVDCAINFSEGDISNNVILLEFGLTPLNGRSLVSQFLVCVYSMQVKGKQMTLAQLAEEWLLNSCKIFQLSFSSNAYANALKEAQQFLWAGSEMDPVSFSFVLFSIDPKHVIKN